MEAWQESGEGEREKKSCLVERGSQRRGLGGKEGRKEAPVNILLAPVGTHAKAGPAQ